MEEVILCDYQVSSNTHSLVLSGILSSAKMSAGNNGRYGLAGSRGVGWGVGLTFCEKEIEWGWPGKDEAGGRELLWFANPLVFIFLNRPARGLVVSAQGI